MAQKQIKELTAATEAQDLDLLVLQQAADDDTVKITKQNLLGGGWQDLTGTHSVATGYNAGNRSYTIDTSVDHSSILSPGMRYYVTRGTTAPTQCFDAELSSSQYASKASPSGITFTTTWSAEAWVKLESGSSDVMAIVSRYNGTNGWMFQVNANNQLQIFTVGTGTDNYYSHQTLPIGEWTHVAVTHNLASTPTFYINGASVQTATTTNTGTAITQAGSLMIGARNSGAVEKYFDGKIAQVRVWSAVRTATQIRDNMNIELTGSETNLVGYWPLDGDFNDSTSNANNLTAQNSAAATNADNPFSDIEYANITVVTSSTITVQGGCIPNDTLSGPYYSTQFEPYGLPKDIRDRFRRVFGAVTIGTDSTAIQVDSCYILGNTFYFSGNATYTVSDTSRTIWNISPSALGITQFDSSHRFIGIDDAANSLIFLSVQTDGSIFSLDYVPHAESPTLAYFSAAIPLTVSP